METTRLQIEAITAHHADHLFEVMLDDAIYLYVDEEPERDKVQLARRYDFLSRGAPEGSDEIWLNWAVKIKSQEQYPEQYIGTLQATLYPNSSADIAYMFSSAFWGKGYATEATVALCHYLFDEHNVSKIFVSVDTKNEPSIKLAKKLGFSCVETVGCTLKGKPAQEHHYRLQHS